ncbi:MAG: hypothetical protein C0405_09990, partial [Desulfovibrio sp.]|nr:hypothetical protein [Desulfovibrio sp.]
LKGKVLDADGSTILDLFSEFGISEKAVNFALTTEATDVAAKCREVTRHINKELKGDSLTYVHCLCGPDFYDALVNHASVRQAFLNYQAQPPARRPQPGLQVPRHPVRGVSRRGHRLPGQHPPVHPRHRGPLLPHGHQPDLPHLRRAGRLHGGGGHRGPAHVLQALQRREA